jgi:hypothetical protein
LLFFVFTMIKNKPTLDITLVYVMPSLVLIYILAKDIYNKTFLQ